MTNEEAIKNLKVLIGLEEFNKLSYKENKAIETLLTAYEQKCNYIKENEIYKKNLFNNYEEISKELEKEKEENKRLRKCHLQYEEMTGIDLLLPEKEE